LVRLSDFDALQQNPVAQQSLAQGVLRIFSSDENENSDLCLKMSCLEYMRNFFNDHMFRVHAYAHMVPDVVRMASVMLQRCAGNSAAINEILDLFRFIVDKYAGMTLMMPETQQTVNDFLLSMLQEAWTHFISVISGSTSPSAEVNFEEVYGEESIVLHSIVRILNHIVVQVKLSDLSEHSVWSVSNTALAIS